MLVAYDVNTETSAGRRRLRRLARACLDFGQRVQNSVFECEVDPAQWVALRARLVSEIDPTADSLRFYRLGAGGRGRVGLVGANPALNLDGPLLFGEANGVREPQARTVRQQDRASQICRMM